MDETTQALMNFIRTGMMAVELQRSLDSAELNAAPFQTLANTPSPATFKVNRVSTPLPNKRLERPLEVKRT